MRSHSHDTVLLYYIANVRVSHMHAHTLYMPSCKVDQVISSILQSLPVNL